MIRDFSFANNTENEQVFIKGPRAYFSNLLKIKVWKNSKRKRPLPP